MLSEFIALLPLLRRKGKLTNQDIREVLGVSRPTATRLAKELCKAGRLKCNGVGRWTHYTLE